MAKKKRKKSNSKPTSSAREAQNVTPNSSGTAPENTATTSQERGTQAAKAPAKQPATPTLQQAKVAARAGKGPGSFLQGTKEELEKVVWPDRQQLISESAAVILMVSLSAVLISLVDNLFGWISQLVF